MKARRIRRIRRMFNGTIQRYKVRESAGLFGDFTGHNRLGLIMSDMEITAGTPVRAIHIFMRRYRKLHKQVSAYERSSYSQTSESWGHIMVVDEKGFKQYYI